MAILFAVIFVLYLAREILAPLAFALTLALILTPAVGWLQKIHIGRVPAVALVMTFTIAATIAVAWVIFDQMVGVANELPRYRQNIHNKLESVRTPGNGALGRAAASLKELGKELSAAPTTGYTPVPSDRAGRGSDNQAPLPVQIVDRPLSVLESASELVKPFLAPLGLAGVVLIFSVFVLIEHTELRNRLLSVVGLNQLNVMTQALDDATRRLSRYLLMQLLMNASFGLVCGTGLYLIGVPYAALWGSVAGILRIVPYVGAVVSALFPFTLALAVFDNWTPTLLVLLLFGALEFVTSNFIEPWLYGAHTGISALALLLSTVFWTALWGPAGLILSTPLTVCVVVLGRHVPQFSFLHVILGDESVLTADARVYQRLLAMDDQEARAVADVYLSKSSLTQLYDSVIVPALTMAEQDRHKGALDPVREEFLFLSIKEMLVELSEKAFKFDTAEQRPPASPGRILILPASDEADAITAAMLAQLLEHAGYPAISFSVDAALQQTIAVMEPSEDDTFCISALPPFAFASAITLSRELERSFPRTKMMVGVWGFTGDTERALQRFQPSRPDSLATSLADAVQFVAAGNPRAADEPPALSA